HEQQLYKLVHSRDKQESLLQMRGIVDRVELLKSDYFSLRLLFNRCMIVLYEAKKTRELASIMSLWLRYTKPETKEFPFVIEALRQNSLDMAYRFYQGPANEKKLALGSFMDSIRTSDDLEAHYQYALLNFAEGPWAELTSNYRSMQRDGLIKGESIVFVETLRSILQDADHLSKADLAEAAERIESISDQHTGVGAKFLFLGYLYHRQVLLSAKNFAFDRDLADKAHRSYLFAIDAAWNNDRIKAGALQNLGLLHSQLRNDSLAAEFLQKRQELPFPNDAVKQAVLWIEAKAMFRSYRPLEALQLIEQALATAPQQSLVFLEKKAFYAWNAGEYQLAADSYARLLPALESKAPAGLYLSQAYTLMKLQKFAEAEQAALKAIERSEQAQKTKSGLDLEQNLKIRFVVLGLLAHSQLPITNLLTYQTERLKLFSKILPLAKILHFQEETLKSQRVKETLDLVLLQLKAGQKEGARNTLQEAIQLTSDYGIAYGYLAHTIFVSLKNIQLVILQEKLPLEPKFEKVLATISEGGEREFANEKNPVPVVRQKWAEVQLINLAFQGQQRSLGLDWFQHESEALLTAESAKILKEEKPKLYDQLQNYRQNMLTTLHKYQQRF
ncbi:MAG: hypothetical protein NTX25_20735, partial [Proteobacteria bacterium]|nr:hypothetical protein [Pseudomonadota bacterium]